MGWEAGCTPEEHLCLQVLLFSFERKGLLSQEGQCLLFSLPRSMRQHKLQGNGELNIIALKLFNILLG